MRGRSTLHGLLLQSYRHSIIYLKNTKNRLKNISLGFSDACKFSIKDRGELSDPSFYSEFYALSDDHIEKTFSKILQGLELRWRGFLENFQKLFSEISAHTAFDREFQGLSKSLFRFDLAARL